MTLNKRLTYFFLFLGTITLFVAACEAVEEQPPVDETPTVDPGLPPAADALANTAWQLESFGPVGAETPVVEGSTVTLQFDGAGQAGGNGGCNSFGGEYRVENGMLSFGEITSTLMACVDESIGEQEQQYYQALESVGEFEVSEDRLTIFYNNGQSVLNFVPAEAAA